MSAKAKALKALRRMREHQNFWLLLKHWKAEDMLPLHFSVYICGPPKTDKTRLVERFQKLWPGCRAREGSDARLDYAQGWAGYDLVLKTGRGAMPLPNGGHADWLFVSVQKCRYFETRTHSGDPDGVPHAYDLTPRFS